MQQRVVRRSELAGARVSGADTRAGFGTEQFIETVCVEIDPFEVFVAVDGHRDRYHLDGVALSERFGKLRIGVGADADHAAHQAPRAQLRRIGGTISQSLADIAERSVKMR